MIDSNCLALDKLPKEKISTITLLIYTNINFTISNIYEQVQIDETFVYAQREKEFKGTPIKSKLKSTFRNSITLIVKLKDEVSTPEQLVNVKLASTGRVHLCGLKEERQAFIVFKHLWNLVKDNSTLYSFKDNFDVPIAIFNPVMVNMIIKLPFLVDREALNRFIKKSKPEIYSIYDSIFNTSVNLKLPISNEVYANLTLAYCNDSSLEVKRCSYYNLVTRYKDFFTNNILNKSFLKLKQKKNIQPKQLKRAYISILIFLSGSCIISARNKDLAQQQIAQFFAFLLDNRKHIEIQLNS